MLSKDQWLAEFERAVEERDAEALGALGLTDAEIAELLED